MENKFIMNTKEMRVDKFERLSQVSEKLLRHGVYRVTMESLSDIVEIGVYTHNETEKKTADKIIKMELADLQTETIEYELEKGIYVTWVSISII